MGLCGIGDLCWRGVSTFLACGGKEADLNGRMRGVKPDHTTPGKVSAHLYLHCAIGQHPLHASRGHPPTKDDLMTL